MSLPRVALLIQPTWLPRLISGNALKALQREVDVVMPQEGRLTGDRLPVLLDGAVACVTGWDTPPMTAPVLDQAPSLRFIAHTAGTLRRILQENVFRRGIRVSHAAEPMASAVAEHVIAQLLTLLQHLAADDRSMHEGGWTPPRWELNRRLLGAQTVGIWGMGRVGRALTRILRGFGSCVLACDPTLLPGEARALGAELVSLPSLFARADAVCLLAPLRHETTGAVTADLLAGLRDGGLLINSGRAGLVDHDAMLRELSSGRISAALDVFAVEPLPEDDPLRSLPNVVLSPHVAGHTVESERRQGEAMTEEVLRFIRGESLRFEIDQAASRAIA